jgi:hypothetical protein
MAQVARGADEKGDRKCIMSTADCNSMPVEMTNISAVMPINAAIKQVTKSFAETGIVVVRMGGIDAGRRLSVWHRRY